MATEERRRGHGEGSIFQRQDGQWVARITLSDGKRKTYYAKTRKEVTAKLRAALKSVDEGISRDTDRQTVAQFLERWLSASVKPSTRHKTYTTYESLCRTAIVPRIGNRTLSKLDTDDMEHIYAELIAAGLSPRTVQHVHRVMHRAFGQAVQRRKILQNPCDGAQAPRVARAEMRAWTAEQADAFLIAAQGQRLHALYVLALTTGMRQGELLGLRWADIDWNAGTLAVRCCLQWQRGNGLVFTEPKTARSRRSIHLAQKTLAALRSHQDRQTFERRGAGDAWSESDLVFCTAEGAPLSPTNETKRFQRAVTAAGLPAIRFHDMRHTAASILLSRGVHVKLVSEMLGHSTIVLTLDTYSHLIPAMHADAAAAMDAVFIA